MPSSSFILHPSSLFVRYWLPPILWAAVIFGLSSLTAEQIPKPILPALVFDKLDHAVIYAVLGALLCRAFAKAHRLRMGLAVFLAVLLTTAYGVSDEFHQTFVPGRNSEWGDVAADCTGSACGSFVLAGFHAWRQRRRT